MLFKKFTEGTVEQTFNDAGECIEQKFNAGDVVEFETEDGDPINVMNMPCGGNEYHPFDMVQPLPVSVGERTSTVEKASITRTQLKLLRKYGFQWYKSATTDRVTADCIEDVVPAANGFTVIYNEKATALVASTAVVLKIELPPDIETQWIRVHWDTITDERR
jgi:hypothetical protein